MDDADLASHPHYFYCPVTAYDWYHGNITDQIRNIANSVFEFLISPVLYVCMGIVQFRLFRNKERYVK